jgi:CDP-diacylglycerol--glycerol-3-phosphate 3-phosphatidyltransferase
LDEGPQIVTLRDQLGIRARQALEPLTRTLQRLHVTPNQITIFGALVNVGAACLVVRGDYVAAGIVFLLGSCLDMLDGALARLARMVTPFGAFFDSTLDRAVEGALLAAIAYRFSLDGQNVTVGITVLALLGSLLVSYTRARAEALGLECKVGLASRAERVVLLSLGLVFPVLLPYAIYLLAALTGITVVQRVVHTYRQIQVR